MIFVQVYIDEESKERKILFSELRHKCKRD